VDAGLGGVALESFEEEFFAGGGVLGFEVEEEGAEAFDGGGGGGEGVGVVELGAGLAEGVGGGMGLEEGAEEPEVGEGEAGVEVVGIELEAGLEVGAGAEEGVGAGLDALVEALEVEFFGALLFGVGGGDGGAAGEGDAEGEGDGGGEFAGDEAELGIGAIDGGGPDDVAFEAILDAGGDGGAGAVAFDFAFEEIAGGAAHAVGGDAEAGVLGEEDDEVVGEVGAVGAGEGFDGEGAIGGGAAFFPPEPAEDGEEEEGEDAGEDLDGAAIGAAGPVALGGELAGDALGDVGAFGDFEQEGVRAADLGVVFDEETAEVADLDADDGVAGGVPVGAAAEDLDADDGLFEVLEAVFEPGFDEEFEQDAEALGVREGGRLQNPVQLPADLLFGCLLHAD